MACIRLFLVAGVMNTRTLDVCVSWPISMVSFRSSDNMYVFLSGGQPGERWCISDRLLLSTSHVQPPLPNVGWVTSSSRVRERCALAQLLSVQLLDVPRRCARTSMPIRLVAGHANPSVHIVDERLPQYSWILFPRLRELYTRPRLHQVKGKLSIARAKYRGSRSPR